MRNYSKQREVILQAVRSVSSHPTAAEIYETVRKVLPNISLGTVYRNLSVLEEAGELRRLQMGDGVDRFDGNCETHLHLHCRFCGAISDVKIPNQTVTELAKQQDFDPETVILTAHGVCSACRQKMMQKNK